MADRRQRLEVRTLELLAVARRVTAQGNQENVMTMIVAAAGEDDVYTCVRGDGDGGLLLVLIPNHHSSCD